MLFRSGTSCGVRLYDAGYVLIDNPRSNSSQDTGNGNALVRLDYLNSRLNSLQSTLQNNINNVNSNLQGQINNINNRVSSVVSSIRLGTRIKAGVSESPFYAGHVITGWGFGDKKELRGAWYWSAPLQYYINGRWITVTNV